MVYPLFFDERVPLQISGQVEAKPLDQLDGHGLGMFHQCFNFDDLVMPENKIDYFWKQPEFYALFQKCRVNEEMNLNGNR